MSNNLDNLEKEVWNLFSRSFPKEAQCLLSWNGKPTLRMDIGDADSKLTGFIEGLRIGYKNGIRDSEVEVLHSLRELREEKERKHSQIGN